MCSSDLTGQFDLGALLLLIIFSMWQMPHSYAIAMFRVDDYRQSACSISLYLYYSCIYPDVTQPMI